MKGRKPANATLLVRFTVLLLVLVFAAGTSAGSEPLVQRLAEVAAGQMAESPELGKIPELSLSPVTDPRLKEALAGALADHQYRISPDAETAVEGTVSEERGPFWERPSRRFSLNLRAVRNGNILWSASMTSPREPVPCWWALPLRIFLALALWPLVVNVLFYVSGAGYEKRKYFVALWVLLVMVLLGTYGVSS